MQVDTGGTPSRSASQGWASPCLPGPASGLMNLPATWGVMGPPNLQGPLPPARQDLPFSPTWPPVPTALSTPLHGLGPPWPSEGPDLTHRTFPPRCPLACPASPSCTHPAPRCLGIPRSPISPTKPSPWLQRQWYDRTPPPHLHRSQRVTVWAPVGPQHGRPSRRWGVRSR